MCVHVYVCISPLSLIRCLGSCRTQPEATAGLLPTPDTRLSHPVCHTVHGSSSTWSSYADGSPGTKRKEWERQLSDLLEGGTRELDLWGTSCLGKSSRWSPGAHAHPCSSHHQSEQRRRGCPPAPGSHVQEGQGRLPCPRWPSPEARGLQCWVAVLILPPGDISKGSCRFFMTVWSLCPKKTPEWAKREHGWDSNPLPTSRP